MSIRPLQLLMNISTAYRECALTKLISHNFAATPHSQSTVETGSQTSPRSYPPTPLFSQHEQDNAFVGELIVLEVSCGAIVADKIDVIDATEEDIAPTGAPTEIDRPVDDGLLGTKETAPLDERLPTRSPLATALADEPIVEPVVSAPAIRVAPVEAALVSAPAISAPPDAALVSAPAISTPPIGPIPATLAIGTVGSALDGPNTRASEPALGISAVQIVEPAPRTPAVGTSPVDSHPAISILPAAPLHVNIPVSTLPNDPALVNTAIAPLEPLDVSQAQLFATPSDWPDTIDPAEVDAFLQSLPQDILDLFPNAEDANAEVFDAAEFDAIITEHSSSPVDTHLLGVPYNPANRFDLVHKAGHPGGYWECLNLYEQWKNDDFKRNGLPRYIDRHKPRPRLIMRKPVRRPVERLSRYQPDSIFPPSRQRPARRDGWLSWYAGYCSSYGNSAARQIRAQREKT